MFKENFYTKTLSDALGRVAHVLPFTPMGITYLTVVVSAVGFVLAWRQEPVWSAFVFLVGCGLDALDGGLARLTGLQSKLGAFIDGTLDRFVDFLLIYSFTFFALPSVVIPFDRMMMFLVYSTLMPVFVVAYANHRGAVQDPDEKKVWRIMNRGELILLLLVALVSVPLSPQLTSWLLFIALVLNTITTIQSIIVAVYKSPERHRALAIIRKR